MKKHVVLTLTSILLLWGVVLFIAVVKTYSTNIIGGADWPTLQFRLLECLRSPFGWAVQLITIAAVIFLGVLIIKRTLKK
ncbi:MAG: hypothetical protein Q4D76_08875 [Oscillospiraceae bacterium]|nr:hypothetical protein [Oscillospiraceae bacterium]